MKLTPSSTTRRSVAMAWSRLGGSPQIPDPVIRMAPKPSRLTVRSPPTSMVPAAAAVGCAFTRYLLLVLIVSLSRPAPACGRGAGTLERLPANEGRLSGLLLAVSVAVYAFRPSGRRGHDGDGGLEVLRQARWRRHLKAGETLPYRYRFHRHRVDLMLFVDARQDNGVFPGTYLAGELDEKVSALAQEHRVTQHPRGDNAQARPVRAGGDDRELPAVPVGP